MSQSGNDNPDYKVGPGKPPIEHRFAPGRSGNPKGRPKKIRLADADELSLTDLILAESKRLLTLTERGEPVTLPAAQAVLRALLVTAGNNNAHAQRTYLKLISDAEDRKQKARSDAFSEAIGLKYYLEAARDKWVAAGRDEMDMAVHPSDIEINGMTGGVKYFMALTDEERAARATLLKDLTENHAILARMPEIIAELGDGPRLVFDREFAVIKIHLSNELLPLRLRRPAPPEHTVSAKTARLFLDDDSLPKDIKSALAQKLGAAV